MLFKLFSNINILYNEMNLKIVMEIFTEIIQKGKIRKYRFIDLP